MQICPRIPFPPHDGGAIAMYDVVSNLSELGHQVTVLAINTPKHFQPANVLEDKARLIPVFVDTSLSVWDAIRNLFKPIPYNLERFISPEVEARLTQLLQHETFDVIQIEGLFVAYYVDVIRKICKTPVVLRAHNVEYLIWERLAWNESNALKKAYIKYLAKGIKRFETEYINKFDAIAAITEQDKTRFEEMGAKSRIEFIPAGVEVSRFRKNPKIQPKKHSMFILSSLNWMPNLEGINWFLEHVWKPVSEKLPDLELHIAGKDAPDYLLKLNWPNVYVHGFVPSAADFMQHYDLMLVPLLSGSGMRIKIIEGMALGKCIISTGIGSEGINCISEENILICDEPDAWIDRIVEYYEGKLCHGNIGKKAEQLITDIYDNKIIIQRFLALYESLK